MNKLISVVNLNKHSIYKLIQTTYLMKTCREPLLKNKTLINYFCEPSTRTSASFHTAMLKLGGNVIPIYGETSSNKKGESIEDSIKTLNYYGDIIVFRHPDIEAIIKLNKGLRKLIHKKYDTITINEFYTSQNVVNVEKI